MVDVFTNFEDLGHEKDMEFIDLITFHRVFGRRSRRRYRRERAVQKRFGCLKWGICSWYNYTAVQKGLVIQRYRKTVKQCPGFAMLIANGVLAFVAP